MADPSFPIGATADEVGIQTLAVAIDPSAGGAGTRSRGRIIAVGDADFLEDQFAQANNQNVIFAANAIDWLAQDEALIAIRSKDRTPPTLAFESDGGRDALKWGSLLGVPAIFALFGVARVTRRGPRAQRRWGDVVAPDGAVGPSGEGASSGEVAPGGEESEAAE